MSDFKSKMHQNRFRLGLRPRPRWGSLQRSPSGILRGPTSKGKEGEGEERREREARGERPYTPPSQIPGYATEQEDHVDEDQTEINVEMASIIVNPLIFNIITIRN